MTPYCGMSRAIGRVLGICLEVMGLGSIAAGLHQVYPPAAFIFVGVALVFIAQGMERGR